MKPNIRTLFLHLIGLLLVLSPLSAWSAPPDTGQAAVTVEILSWPTSVAINQSITVRWRITGGTSVTQTRVVWGLQSGYYVDGAEPYYSGGPGEYQHTFSLPYAGTVYLQVTALVDGAEYRSLERTVDVLCAASFSENHDRAHAASIVPNHTYTGCPGAQYGDWYVVNVPACSAMHVYADPAPGPVGGGQGVVLDVYDAAGTQLASEYPYCGGGYGRCSTVDFSRSFPQAATLYLNVWGTGASYELAVNTSALAFRTDEFYACMGGPSADCWMPWYWHWTDPLGDTETDFTREGDLWWMYVPGGGTHDLHETTNAPRFTQSVCGDFAVETDVTLSRSGGYQSAGLLVWQNATNFMRWEVNDSGALRALRMRGGVWSDSGNLAYLPSSVRLRMQRVGQRIDCFAFVGGAWTHYGSWDLVSGAVEVGLFVVNVGAATPASATFDYVRSVSPLPVGPTPTPTSGTPTADFQWRAEAEDATLTAPMAVQLAASACGGKVVASNISYSGEVAFSVTVPRADNYYLWARARGSDWNGNSFSVAFDSDTPIHYEVPQFGGLWVLGWDRVHQVDQAETPFWLAAGTHILHFTAREPNTALDAVMLVSSSQVVPSGCPVTATATWTPASGTATLTRTRTPTSTRTPTPTITRTPMPARVRLPLICRGSNN